MTEKAEKEKKVIKASGNTKPPAKESAKVSEKKNSSSSDNGSNEGGVEKPQQKIKNPPTAEDLKRYESYVGKKWTGKCRWFNVMKGFGFIDPYFEEAKQHDDDVFVHQVKHLKNNNILI